MDMRRPVVELHSPGGVPRRHHNPLNSAASLVSRRPRVALETGTSGHARRSVLASHPYGCRGLRGRFSRGRPSVRRRFARERLPH